MELDGFRIMELRNKGEISPELEELREKYYDAIEEWKKYKDELESETASIQETEKTMRKMMQANKKIVSIKKDIIEFCNSS